MLMLTTVALLSSTAPSLPPMVPAPAVSDAPRAARLLDDEPAPTPTPTLVGRMVLAPLGGAVGAAVSGALGLLMGGAIGALAGGGWNVLLVGVFGALIAAPFGFALGVALGASLLTTHFAELFRRTLPWAFLAAGITIIGVFVAAIVALPVVALVGGSVAIAAAAAVPALVEGRRGAERVERGPESSLALATF
ncbi:MAG: hypothetical protein GQE15_12715 [Archangiaceae bacterium]|nr:hypothetical protein [Archangiaceae bacterium]